MTEKLFDLTSPLATLFVVAALSSPASLAGAAQPASGNPAPAIGQRIFSFADRNGDKSLDAQEFGNLSASMQKWLVQHGFDAGKSLTQAQFLQIADRMMAELRRGRVRAGVAAPAAIQPTSSQTTGSSKATAAKTNGAGTSTSPVATPVVIEQTVSPATAALPAEFQPVDTDGDGQISFYEWRQQKRNEMPRFYQLDQNKDQVLSLAELTTVAPATAASPGATGAAPTASTTSTTPTATATGGPSPQRLKDIKYIIGALDKNKNGLVDPDEWAISRRIKPAFEKAKVDISKPMNEATFIVNY